MATAINTLFGTLLDFVKRKAPDGSIDGDIVEILVKMKPFLEQMTWRPTNDLTTHKHTIRTGYPTGTWRQLYGFTQPSKSTTKQVTDATGLYEQWSEIDAEYEQIEGENFNAYRMDEDQTHIEAMAQDVVRTIFYGDGGLASFVPNIAAFPGLSIRFGLTTAENGGQIILGGGSTANVQTSVWLIQHDRSIFHGIFPKNSTAGMTFKNVGRETKTDANGGLMEVIRSKYNFRGGIAVRDWRGIVRLANLEPGSFDGSTDAKNPYHASYTGPDFIKLFTDMWFKLYNPGIGTKAMYANRQVVAALTHLANRKTLPQLTMEGIAGGGPLVRFWGIPIYMTEELQNTETVVS